MLMENITSLRDDGNSPTPTSGCGSLAVFFVATEETAWQWLRELTEPRELKHPLYGNSRVGIERYRSFFRNDEDESSVARYIRVFEVER